MRDRRQLSEFRWLEFFAKTGRAKVYNLADILVGMAGGEITFQVPSFEKMHALLGAGPTKTHHFCEFAKPEIVS